MLTFDDWFSQKHAAIPVSSAKAVLTLSEGGATLPFIARYRKEQTGNLDEVAIQSVLDAKESWDAVQHRKKHICEEIEKQGKLTPELKAKIEGTYELERLEDLYLPYKLKRKTKAMTAREAGLEPLADWMWKSAHEDAGDALTLDAKAAEFLSPEKKIETKEQAIEGARDIVVERLSEDLGLREHVRKTLFEQGFVRSKKGEKAKPNSKFERYFAHHERVSALLRPEASHRYLAMRRGQLCSRSDIEAHIYDDRAEPMSNVIDSAIYALRRKIDPPGGPSLIQTRRGAGYVFGGDAGPGSESP